jgi:uncharacterized membrane protein
MIKKNKGALILSSILILLPGILGLIFWDKLPEQMTTHWGFDGAADGVSDRHVTVFVLPLILLAFQWLAVLITAKDPKNKGQSNKVFRTVIWILPVMSLFLNGLIYVVSFGQEVRVELLTLMLLGLLFIVMGNYMPKCKQNYTIGIKIKWTLQDEQNWNATHRFAGKVWVAGGLLMMASVFIPNVTLWVLISSALILALIPSIYSYLYYKKQVKEGTANIKPLLVTKKQKVFALVFIAAILIFVLVMMFAGSMKIEYGDTAFTLKITFWSDLTVKYDAVDSIEFRQSDAVGTRVSGLGSARLLAGNFRNEEFGNYTRYSYTGNDASIVLKVEGKTLVIAGKDVNSTQNIYQELLERTVNKGVSDN